MDAMKKECEGLKRFRSPQGWGIAVHAYRQYVVQTIREELSFDEVSDLMYGLKCSLEELADKVVEAQMAGSVRARALAAARQIPPEPPKAATEPPVLRDLRSQVDALTDAMQGLIRSQQDTASRILHLAAEIAALKARIPG
jgi:hypothetical protein